MSLSRSDGDFNPKGEYWRGSVWLPTAYMALKGLANYGYLDEAHQLATTLLEHMEKTYTDFEPHTIWECYSPCECKPATIETGEQKYVRPDFCGWSALGPISIYIEFVLGFYEIDAFDRVIKWAKPDVSGEVGIENLRFGDIITDICACGKACTVKSNKAYTLEINSREYAVNEGINEFEI